MTYEQILTRFQVVRRYEDKAQCTCPVHSDQQASLTVSRGRNSTILYCHAGCNYRDILSAVGLSPKDLYYDDSRPQSGNWRSYIERREGRQIEAVYDYVGYQTGSYLYTKLRLTGKKMLYGLLTNNRFTYGLGGHSRKELKGIYAPNGLEALNKAITEGKPIFYVEGEKDTNTLATRGYTAMTAGGVNDWQPEFAEPLRGAEVVILADNDTPGKQLASRVLADLQGIAKSVRIVIPTPDLPKADISDYFAKGHNNQEFEQLIKSSVTDTTVGSPTSITDTTVPKDTQLNTDDIRQLLMYKIEYDKDGNEKSRKLIQSVKNFEIVLDNDCRFKSKIKFDEFSQQTNLMGNTPWETSGNNYRAWSSFDDSALFSILQSDYGLNNRNDYFDALKNVAMRNRFHPVRDMLNSLEYKGEGYIRSILPNYLGAACKFRLI